MYTPYGPFMGSLESVWPTWVLLVQFKSFWDIFADLKFVNTKRRCKYCTDVLSLTPMYFYLLRSTSKTQTFESIFTYFSYGRKTIHEKNSIPTSSYKNTEKTCKTSGMDSLMCLLRRRLMIKYAPKTLDHQRHRSP